VKSTQTAPARRTSAPPSGPASTATAGRGNAFAQERLKSQGAQASGEAEARSVLSTPSQAIPDRAALEARFGVDLSAVRMHVGEEANGIVRAAGALGLTFGEHIAFATDTPDSELIAHELAHVLQQRAGTGGEAADEREADAVEKGAAPEAPRMNNGGGAPAVRYKLPTNQVETAELEQAGNEKIEGKKAATLDAKKAAAAISYNNKKWTGARRQQLRVYLGAPPDKADGDFTESEVKEAQAIQLGAGIASDKADGMIGDATMAILLETGFTFDLDAQGKVDPKDVTLTFFPGEFEDLAAWKAEVDAAKAIDPVSPYRRVNAPEGTGRIYVKHKGNTVAVMNARGGPALTLKDGSHSADPTSKGTWKLGKGRPHTTNAWAHSQIAWGTPVRKRTDGEWEYQDTSSTKWMVATGKDTKLKTPLSRSDFENYNQGRSTWMVNDFGAEAWRIEGTAGQFLHTTPNDEESVMSGQTPVLSTSHGCVHLDPAERAEMSKLGYLQGGVTLVIKAYDQHMLPAELRQMMEG
jgi:hypothetical protein